MTWHKTMDGSNAPIKAMQLAHDLLIVTGLVPHPRLSYPKMVKAVLGLYNTLHACDHIIRMCYIILTNVVMQLIIPNHTTCMTCSCTAVQFVVQVTMVIVVTLTASNVTKTILQ